MTHQRRKQRKAASNIVNIRAVDNNVGRNYRFETLSRLRHFPLRRRTQCSYLLPNHTAARDNREITYLTRPSNVITGLN